MSVRRPRVQGKRWPELAEQRNAALAPAPRCPTLPSGFAPTRGHLHLCSPFPQHGECAYRRPQAQGTGCCQSVQPAPWSLVNAGSMVGQSKGSEPVGQGTSDVFADDLGLSTPQPRVCLMQNKAFQRLFLLSQDFVCAIVTIIALLSLSIELWFLMTMKTIYISKYLTPVN